MGKNSSKKKKWIIFLLLCVFGVVAAHPLILYAMDKGEAARMHYQYRDFFRQNSIIQNIANWLVWMIIKGLRWFAENSQNLYKYTLGLIDFTQYGKLTRWIRSFEMLFKAILTLSIAYFGITLIINHKKKPEVLTSIVLAALCISALSSLMITANNSVVAFCEAQTSDSFSDSIINQNMYDLMYIDMNYGLATFSTDPESLAKYHCEDSEFDIDSIDINEVVNYKSKRLSDDGKYLLSKKYTYFNGYTDYEEIDVYNGFGWNSGDDADLFNEFYYRYKVNGFPIIVSLIATILVFLCISYKTCRLIVELGIKKLLAILYSADITGTQKTLKILGNIKDSYIILALTAVLLKIFHFFQLYLQSKFANNVFVYCMLLIFAAFTIIDGPNLIQSLTGEDAGLQSGYGHIMAMWSGARGMKDKAVGHAANAVRAGVGYGRYRKIRNSINGATSKGADKGAAKLKSGATGVDGTNADIKNAMDKKDAGKGAAKPESGAGSEGGSNADMTKDQEAMNPSGAGQEKDLGAMNPSDTGQEKDPEAKAGKNPQGNEQPTSAKEENDKMKEALGGGKKRSPKASGDKTAAKEKNLKPDPKEQKTPEKEIGGKAGAGESQEAASVPKDDKAVQSGGSGSGSNEEIKDHMKAASGSQTKNDTAELKKAAGTGKQAKKAAPSKKTPVKEKKEVAAPQKRTSKPKETAVKEKINREDNLK